MWMNRSRDHGAEEPEPTEVEQLRARIAVLEAQIKEGKA